MFPPEIITATFLPFTSILLNSNGASALAPAPSATTFDFSSKNSID